MLELIKLEQYISSSTTIRQSHASKFVFIEQVVLYILKWLMIRFSQQSLAVRTRTLRLPDVSGSSQISWKPDLKTAQSYLAMHREFEGLGLFSEMAKVEKYSKISKIQIIRIWKFEDLSNG